jgi:hypothetical protein
VELLLRSPFWNFLTVGLLWELFDRVSFVRYDGGFVRFGPRGVVGCTGQALSNRYQRFERLLGVESGVASETEISELFECTSGRGGLLA